MNNKNKDLIWEPINLGDVCYTDLTHNRKYKMTVFSIERMDAAKFFGPHFKSEPSIIFYGSSTFFDMQYLSWFPVEKFILNKLDENYYCFLSQKIENEPL